MSKKHVYTKDLTGFGDFVYVDLLPEVRRAKQFNMRIIIALLLSVSLTFVLIYIPYSSATFKLEDINSDNNDLQHELALTQEEFEGYEINVEAIQFDKDITSIAATKTNFNDLYDYLEIFVDLNDGRIKDVYFDLSSGEIVFTVSMVNYSRYSILNNQILNLSWVSKSSFTDPNIFGDDIEYTGVYTIEVNLDAE
jgi:hypothetical protein